MTWSISKKEIEDKNSEFTEKLLNNEEKIVDLTYFKTSDYIKCTGETQEIIEGRKRLAFVRCPKCREFISVYSDEIDLKGRTKIKRCLCGFRSYLSLTKWKNI